MRITYQRAENGALALSSLDQRFGVPRFSVQRPPNPKCFGAIWGKNLGRPKCRSNDDGSIAPFSEKLEKAETCSRFRKTSCTEGRHKFQGSVDPMFPAGLPFPVPEIQEFIAFRDSGKNFQRFSRNFPGAFPPELLQRWGTEKAHKFFQHKLFGPHPKHPNLGPQKKVYVPHFLGKDAKRDSHNLFRGDFGGQKQGPKRAIFGHKKFSLLFCSCLPRNSHSLLEFSPPFSAL